MGSYKWGLGFIGLVGFMGLIGFMGFIGFMGNNEGSYSDKPCYGTYNPTNNYP